MVRNIPAAQSRPFRRLRRPGTVALNSSGLTRELKFHPDSGLQNLSGHNTQLHCDVKTYVKAALNLSDVNKRELLG